MSRARKNTKTPPTIVVATSAIIATILRKTCLSRSEYMLIFCSRISQASTDLQPHNSAERPRSLPGRSSRVVRLLLGNLPEIGDSTGAPGGEFLSVTLDSLQLVECDCCQVAFSTMRTGNHWYPLDHEQVAATAITPCYATLPGSLFTANLSDHRISNCHG